MRSSNALTPISNLINGKASEESKTINQSLPDTMDSGKYGVFFVFTFIALASMCMLLRQFSGSKNIFDNGTS